MEVVTKNCHYSNIPKFTLFYFYSRKIMLDIAIPQNTGFVAKSVETCLCPKGNVTRSLHVTIFQYWLEKFRLLAYHCPEISLIVE